MAAIGTTASNFEILSKLAEGGMAELFLARVVGQAGNRRHVVLKRIARERATDTQFVQMFLDEARLVAQLRHPNIAQVFDIGRLGVSYYFTMEYVHGVTIEDLIEKVAERGSVLPVDAVMSILFGTAAGLGHAHERTGNDGKPLGIVHRDISPSNLMVSYDGHVKVVDFGVAKAQMNGRPETQAGEIKGKVGYLSPEQCRLQKLDRRSDLYSLGVVAWEMLTGKRLWKRETPFGTMAAIATEEVPLVSEYREDLWPEVDALVSKLLATEVTDRFQSAREVIEAVELVAMTTKSNTSPNHLARFMRELFGTPAEPWVAVQRESVEVAAAPIPAELDTHDEDPLVDTVEHKLTSVFSAVVPEDETDASATNVLALGDRLSTASGRSPPPRPSRVGTELLPDAETPRAATETLSPEAPTQRGSTKSVPPPIADPAWKRTMIGDNMPPPLHLPRGASLQPPGRMLPSGDPTAPLGTLSPSARVPESDAILPSSGSQLPPSAPQLPPVLNPNELGPPQPRWPPPRHGDVSTLHWWIIGGAVLGIVLVLVVLVSRSDDRSVVTAPPASDAMTIAAITPDAGERADAAIETADAAIETADAAIETVNPPEPDAATAMADTGMADATATPDAEVDDMKDLEQAKPQPSNRQKLRTKPELNAAFRERRYQEIVTACMELGADDDRAVVCVLAACRARAREAQDWYRNVPPKNREGTINICKQSGYPIKDVCATDLFACRK